MARGRRRVGVALMLDGPVADEVQGLRRALGDRSIARIDPHITLVPPLNLRDDDLGAALALLRGASGAAPPDVELTIGPVATFAPANPVLYLEVSGHLPVLSALRTAVFVPPLFREPTWPWVAHVTVADEIDDARIAAAVGALRAYRRDVAFDRLVLLELQEGKWGPLADVALGPLSRVGTGGFALELARSRMLDPEGRALIDELGDPVAAHGAARSGPLRRSPVVITARSAGSVCGVAGAWIDDAGGHVEVYVQVGQRRRGVGRHLLAAAESAVASAGWQCGLLRASGPAQFYTAVSCYSKVTEV